LHFIKEITMKRWLFLLAFVVGVPLLASAPSKPVQGQIEVEPDADTSYRVRVINEMGEWIRLKIVGFRRDANYRVDLDQGDYATQELYSGPRVLCAWNRHGDLMLVVALNINRNGKLRIRPLYGSEPGAAAPAARSSENNNNAGLPSLEIEGQ